MRHPKSLTDIGRAALAILETGRKPTIPEVSPLIDAYEQLPGNSVGGSLWFVLWHGPNLEDRYIEACMRDAERDGDEDGAALLRVMLRMSMTQRRKL